jgi:hypothetical protein
MGTAFSSLRDGAGVPHVQGMARADLLPLRETSC